jgi:heme exporter protein D
MTIAGLDLGPHWAFIVIAYGLTVTVVLALLAWILVDHRLLRRTLDGLEARGIRRRSAGSGR